MDTSCSPNKFFIEKFVLYVFFALGKVKCSILWKYGFQQSNSDHTLFLKHRLGKVTALIVYVDDMIVTGDDAEEISKLQEQLVIEF
jgi:hypothetical protein